MQRIEKRPSKIYALLRTGALGIVEPGFRT